MSRFADRLAAAFLHAVVGMAIALATTVLKTTEALLTGELEASLRTTRFRRFVALPLYRRLQRRLSALSSQTLGIARDAARGDVEAILGRSRTSRLLLLPLYRRLARRWRRTAPGSGVAVSSSATSGS